MNIKRARGPVVEALKRYDPGLRVRWSWEKKMWAVDAPLKKRDAAWIEPPVRFEKTATGFKEHLLPELSERSLNFKEKRYTICWSKNLDWRLYWAIVRRDSHKMTGGAASEFVRKFKEQERVRKANRDREKSDHVYEAYDRLKFLNRRQPWADPVGGGISTKGMGI